jgi:hypothetical protein
MSRPSAAVPRRHVGMSQHNNVKKTYRGAQNKNGMKLCSTQTSDVKMQFMIRPMTSKVLT